MGSREREFIDVSNRASLDAMVGKPGDSRSDAGFGAAYRQARANVLEASMCGLVRLRVI